MRCDPGDSCTVVGVLPTNTPSTSISAAATGELTEIAALPTGTLGVGVGAAALFTDVAAGPMVWLAAGKTSNAVPRLSGMSAPFRSRKTGAAGQNTTAAPAVRMPVLTAWLCPDFLVTV